MYSYITIANKVSNHNQLKQLHAHFILNSLHQNNFYVSLLISQCTRLKAPTSYTHFIFNSIVSPNAYLHSCLLKYYSHLGAHANVVSHFQLMQADNIRPEIFTYPILIKYAGENGTALHAHVVKLGYVNDGVVCNAIMGMYAKHGPVEIGRKVFDEMSVRSIADWNSMVSGYWRWGMKESAVELFDEMPERNVISWTCMVTGFSKMKDLVNARKYFDGMPVKSVVSWNAMLSGYAQNGFIDEALQLFVKMLSFGVRPDERTWVTIISACSSSGDPSLVEAVVGLVDENKICFNSFVKTALLDLYAKCGKLEAARNIFDGLGDVQGSTAAWNAMISAYARVGDVDSARELFDKMVNKDVISWNSMIAGYAQNGQSPLAIELFKEMISVSRLKPDEVTVVSVLSACGHLGALEFGKFVVDFVSKTKIKLGIAGYNAMIFMYSKCGSMKEAMRIFQDTNVKDVVSYNTLITGFAAHGDGIGAIELVSKMEEEEEGIKPDRLTYLGVLTACSHGGLVEEARKIYDLIDSPSVDHYASMIDLLGRVGQLDEALQMIKKMPIEPQPGIYGSLLNASRIHKRVEIGEFVANKLFELEPNNSGNYVLLSNIYASAGRWNDVQKVRNMMKDRGVSKATGWSLVEYEGKMHKFIAGDKSHERSEDIYTLLSELRKKMRKFGYLADKSCALTDVEEEEKEEMVGTHSEKLAVSFALVVSEPGTVIRVVKNLRVCTDCHRAIKIISKLEGREIIVRDNNRFHCFKDGQCSCNDYW